MHQINQSIKVVIQHGDFSASCWLTADVTKRVSPKIVSADVTKKVSPKIISAL